MAEYDWGHDTSHLNPPFDVVIVSDCILPKLYPIEPLVQVYMYINLYNTVDITFFLLLICL